jgi:alanine racemase
MALVRPSIPPHATHAEIDVAAFRHNLSAVRHYTGENVAVIAVVKANAYGHGAVRLAREAIQWGAEYLAVARVPEAIDIFSAGITHRMLVFEIAEPVHVKRALALEMELTVVDVKGTEEIAGIARRLGMRAVVHVKVDTGMGRLGLSWREAAATIERIARVPGIVLKGVYSHFATSEDSDQSYARAQLDFFRELLEDLRRRRVEVPLRHMANSGAIISLHDSYFDAVRPGIMLYGYAPGRNMRQQYPVRPVMSLFSRVAFVKTVEAGVSVSYGRRFTAKSRTCIATVPIGYADGVSRLLSDRGRVLIKGRAYPVVGTVCMDMIMADLGSKSDVKEGDWVTIIGSDGKEQITAWDVSEVIGTIPYEVTSLITPRVERVYTEVKDSPAGMVTRSRTGAA